MANENCVANTPFSHEYAMTAYGSGSGAFTRKLAPERFALKAAKNSVQDEGMTGSLWREVGSEIIASEKISGTVVHNPRADELMTLFPCLMGGVFASGVLTPTKICEFFSMGSKDGTALRILKYNNLVTSTWDLSASDSSQLLKLTMNLEGQTRTRVTGIGTWPSGMAFTGKQPLVFRQCVLTLDAVAYRFKSMRLAGNNNIQGDDFFNSLTRVEMPSAAQDFTLTTELPWDTGAMVDWADGELTASAEIVFTSGGDSLTIEMPELYSTPEDPEKSGRRRLLNSIEWRAKNDSAGDNFPIRVTVVSV